MNPKLVRRAVAYATELGEQNNGRIKIIVNGNNSNSEIRPYLGERIRFDVTQNALIVEYSDGMYFIDIDSINSINCYKQKI